MTTEFVQPEQNDIAQPTDNKQPELTVQDLTSLKTIIDIASQRGTFKASEMSAVGQVYTKLETFLQAIQAQQAASAENTEQGE